jgi:hypothetical protein
VESLRVKKWKLCQIPQRQEISFKGSKIGNLSNIQNTSNCTKDAAVYFVHSKDIRPIFGAGGFLIWRVKTSGECLEKGYPHLWIGCKQRVWIKLGIFTIKVQNFHSPNQETIGPKLKEGSVGVKKILTRLVIGLVILLAKPEFYSHLASSYPHPLVHGWMK